MPSKLAPRKRRAAGAGGQEKPLLLTEAKAERVPLYTVAGWQRKLGRKQRRVPVLNGTATSAGTLDGPPLPDLIPAQREVDPLPPLLNGCRTAKGGLPAGAAHPDGSLPRFDRLWAAGRRNIRWKRCDATQIALYSKVVNSYTAASCVNFGVWAEVVLMQVFHLTAHAPSPCPLRTSLCCFLLSKLCATFAGDVQPLMNVLLTEVFNSMFVNYDVDLTKTFGGAAGEPGSPKAAGKKGSDAAAAGPSSPASPKSPYKWDGGNAPVLEASAVEAGDLHLSRHLLPESPGLRGRKRSEVLAANPFLLATPGPGDLFDDFAPKPTFEDALRQDGDAVQAGGASPPVSPGMPPQAAKGGFLGARAVPRSPSPLAEVTPLHAASPDPAAHSMHHSGRAAAYLARSTGSQQPGWQRDNDNFRQRYGNDAAAAPPPQPAADATPADTPCFAKLCLYATKMREMEDELRKLRAEKEAHERQWGSWGPMGLDSKSIASIQALRAENESLRFCLMQVYFRSWKKVTTGEEHQESLITQVVQETKRKKLLDRCFRQWRSVIRLEQKVREEKARKRMGLTMLKPVAGPETPREGSLPMKARSLRDLRKRDKILSPTATMSDASGGGGGGGEKWAMYKNLPTGTSRFDHYTGYRKFAYVAPGFLLRWCNVMMTAMEQDTMVGFVLTEDPEELKNWEVLYALAFRVCPSTAGDFVAPADVDFDRRVDVICTAVPEDFSCPVMTDDLLQPNVYAWSWLLLLGYLRWWWANPDTRDPQFMMELSAIDTGFDNGAAAELFRSLTRATLDHLAANPQSMQAHVAYRPAGLTLLVDDMQELLMSRAVADVIDEFAPSLLRIFSYITGKTSSAESPLSNPLDASTASTGQLNARKLLLFFEESYISPGLLAREASVAAFMLGVRHTATYSSNPHFLTPTSFNYALAYAMFYVDKAAPIHSPVDLHMMDGVEAVAELTADDLRTFFIKDILPAFETYARLKSTGAGSFRLASMRRSKSMRSNSTSSPRGPLRIDADRYPSPESSPHAAASPHGSARKKSTVTILSPESTPFAVSPSPDSEPIDFKCD